MQKIVVPLAWLLLYSMFSYAQQVYNPLQNDSLVGLSLLNNTAKKLEVDKSSFSGENKKYFIKEYQERFDHIKKMYDKKELITDPAAKKYLDNLVSVILKANPHLQALQPNVLFSKTHWPNAASFGEGTIVFNVSLFHRLRNESQAAFIICHELSHLYLDHSNRSIEQYVNTVYSKEFQQQLKDIKRQAFQQGRKLEALAKNLTYKNRRHGRDHEMEADSLALELLKSTGFDVRESLTCLALLDSVDKEKYYGSLHLAKQFNFPEYPFRKSWLRKPSISIGEAMAAHSGNADSLLTEKDSLKTHPQCDVRIARLKPKAENYYNSSQQFFLVNNVMFDSLVNSFDFELIEYCYQSDNIGRALYYALQLFYNKKDNSYLATMIGKCMNKIHAAQKNHTLDKIVDLDEGAGDEEYNEYSRFLQALKLPDIASLSYYFLKQHYPLFMSDRDFLETYNNSKAVFTSYTN